MSVKIVSLREKIIWSPLCRHHQSLCIFGGEDWSAGKAVTVWFYTRSRRNQTKLRIYGRSEDGIGWQER